MLTQTVVKTGTCSILAYRVICSGKLTRETNKNLQNSITISNDKLHQDKFTNQTLSVSVTTSNGPGVEEALHLSDALKTFWLQSSCRVVYKSGKPEVVEASNRILTLVLCSKYSNLL